MVQNQSRIGQRNASTDERDEEHLPRYVIDLEGASARDRALGMLVASRRCYACQQEDDQQPSVSSDVKPYMDRIAKHCGQESDYLTPDTPLKEAIFRVLLAGGNQPLKAEEIGQILADKWAMTSYPRNTSSVVIQRLMDHSESYCIVMLPEPVTEEQEAPADPGDPPEATPGASS